MSQLVRASEDGGVELHCRDSEDRWRGKGKEETPLHCAIHFYFLLPLQSSLSNCVNNRMEWNYIKLYANGSRTP